MYKEKRYANSGVPFLLDIELRCRLLSDALHYLFHQLFDVVEHTCAETEQIHCYYGNDYDNYCAEVTASKAASVDVFAAEREDDEENLSNDGY